MKKMIVLLCMILVIMTGCQPKTDPTPVSDTYFALGTVVTITLYDGSSHDLIDQCFTEITRLENLLSKSIEGSDIYLVNQHAGISETVVSPETMEVIKKGIEYGTLSDGAFDISIGPLVNLWKIGEEGAKVPAQTEIDQALMHIDYRDIIIDNAKNSVFLPYEGMVIDLGGIAKGYIADKVAALLDENGCNSALINLGGNVLTVGIKPTKELWKIGIQDPMSNRGDYLAIVDVGVKSVVTSGIYERFFIENGIRYHHILNPFTGYPYESDITGVSIISDKSVDGDALSTTCFALSIEKAMALIETLPDTEAVFVNQSGEIFKTSGIGNTVPFTQLY
ncbi:MAG: FAD:protein FMN transferase [Clostridia bacterium]|nr:FAD:protein FMN transferase [Clostridia bacterium]